MSRPGEFELLVLLASLRLGPEQAYAVSIAEEIGTRTGRRVGRASVYTALGRLEDKGLVATGLGEPRPERGGKARRLVTVSGAGLEAVREATTELRAMLGGLEGILEGGA
jgi:DNA-binding PadR family transcriptional regulator